MPTFSPPEIVSFPSSPLGPQMVLVARTDTGFAWRYWFDDNHFGGGNGWGDWQSWQFDPQNRPQDWTGFSFQDGPIPPGWPLVGYIDQDGVSRLNGFFAFAQDTSGDGRPVPVVGQPWWRIPVANVAFDVFGRDFWPRVGIAWYNGPIPRLNIFGASTFEPGGILRELWWDGGNWNWHDHEEGPDGDKLGPSSLIFPDTNNGYLFAITDPRDNVLLYAWRQESNWGWADNFQGPGGITDLRAPVAVTYSDDRGINVHVFAVGQVQNGDYHLFQAHQVLGNDWEGWQDFGMPPDEPALPCEELPDIGIDLRTRFVSGDPFTMTSASIWRDGQGLRINMFGHSDIVAQFDPRVGRGCLVHFSWKGGDWRNGHWTWEESTRPDECLNVETTSGPARLAATFKSVSSAVYQGQTRDGQSRQRVSAVGFTHPGQSGNIWEFALDTAVDQDFHWTQLE